MKTPKTLRRETYKKTLKDLLEGHPEASKVKEKYRVLMYLLSREWKNLILSRENETMKDFLKDVIYADRLIRKQTEDIDEEEKEILSQEFQLNELPKM